MVQSLLCLHHNGGSDEAAKTILEMVDRVPYYMNLYHEEGFRLDLSGTFVIPNDDQVKKCIFDLFENYSCKSLFLHSFENETFDSGLVEILQRVASKQFCCELELEGRFSDNAILMVHDFLKKNGLIRDMIEFRDVEMSDMASALLSNTKLESSQIRFEGSPLVHHLSRNLSDAEHVTFHAGNGSSLSRKVACWNSLGELLYSSKCNVSSFDIDADCSEQEHLEIQALLLFMDRLTTNSFIRHLDLRCTGRFTQNHLQSIMRNLFKFTNLRSLELYVSQASSLEFLRPLLLSAKDNTSPASIISLKSIHLNCYKGDASVSKQDEDILLNLVDTIPTLVSIEGVGKSALLEHQLRMKANWRQFLARNDDKSVTLPSVWPLVVATVARRESSCYFPTKDVRYAPVPSIRFCMIQHLVNYGYFISNETKINPEEEDGTTFGSSQPMNE